MSASKPIVPGSKRPVTGVMAELMLAATPGLLVMAYWFGAGLWWNLLLAASAALATEAIALKLRGASLDALGDLSALTTAVLLAVCLPPGVAWQVPVIAAVCAIGLGKQVYGGLGQNLFNPAMVGYAVVLISFPAALADWPALTGAVDGVSSATPLDQARMTRIQADLAGPPSALSMAAWPWLSIAMAFTLGGLWLRWRQLIDWTIPLAVLAGLGLPAVLDSAFGGATLAPLDHLIYGATLFGAFFIATDPVSAPGRPRARLLYGLLIGLLIFAIRRWGAYPDALAFAVLLANAGVPLLDHWALRRAKR